MAYDWCLVDNTIFWIGRLASLLGPTGAREMDDGGAFHRRIHPDDMVRRRTCLTRHIEQGDAFDCEYRMRDDSGEFHWVHERGSVHLSAEGEPVRLAGTLRDISRGKETEARLEYRANFDELTGHFNRSRLREALEQSLVYGRRYKVTSAYLTVGIEKLNKFSEAFGYETADAVILNVGQRLERNLRASDSIGRVSGDCFGIVLTKCPEKELETVAEKLLDVVHEAPIETPNGPVHVSVSIGGVLFPSVARSSHDIMAKSEIALIEARQTGRNAFIEYRRTKDQQRSRQQNMVIAEEVQQALTEKRLVLAFQPIVSATDHTVSHYECLLRLKTRDGGIMAAAGFIPIIEELGLVRQVDRYALELAVDELANYPRLRLAVNVSGLTAADRSWLRLLVALVRSRSNIAERLTIEITETVALQDIDETAQFVAAVRNLGCKVALDDFGAGYTSFRNLKALSVDEVKIDGSFVRDVADNLDNQLFIRTLLGLANGFNLITVAECVETERDARLLASHGVDFLQGYYFGRPEIERPWLNDQATAVAEALGGTPGEKPASAD